MDSIQQSDQHLIEMAAGVPTCCQTSWMEPESLHLYKLPVYANIANRNGLDFMVKRKGFEWQCGGIVWEHRHLRIVLAGSYSLWKK
jgi:hypothetical protein